MGTQYPGVSISGYNSSPPQDDGTQAASNLITWAGIKTKLADPLKIAIEAINGGLVSYTNFAVRQITANDNTVAGDHMRVVEIAPTVTVAVTVSLGDAATMTNVYRVYIKNSSAINQTIGRVTGTDTIDGTAGNITIAPGEGRIFQTNSTPNGYLTLGMFGQHFPTATLTDGATISWDLISQRNAKVTLGGNRALANPTNKRDGQGGVLRVIQDGTGSRTLSWGTDFKFTSGVPPVLTTTANATDLFSFHCDGTNVHVAQFSADSK